MCLVTCKPNLTQHSAPEKRENRTKPSLIIGKNNQWKLVHLIEQRKYYIHVLRKGEKKEKEICVCLRTCTTNTGEKNVKKETIKYLKDLRKM